VQRTNNLKITTESQVYGQQTSFNTTNKIRCTVSVKWALIGFLHKRKILILIQRKRILEKLSKSISSHNTQEFPPRPTMETMLMMITQEMQ
jgi:hypothetical protein